jgi:hypothetical protein
MRIDELLEEGEALKELCEEIAQGEREPWPELLSAAVRRAAASSDLQELLMRLNVVARIRRAEEAAFLRLTAAERMLCYRKGRITRHQARFWECRFPREIPRVNGLPEWVAARSIDIAEARRR